MKQKIKPKTIVISIIVIIIIVLGCIIYFSRVQKNISLNAQYQGNLSPLTFKYPKGWQTFSFGDGKTVYVTNGKLDKLIKDSTAGLGNSEDNSGIIKEQIEQNLLDYYSNGLFKGTVLLKISLVDSIDSERIVSNYAGSYNYEDAGLIKIQSIDGNNLVTLSTGKPIPPESGEQSNYYPNYQIYYGKKENQYLVVSAAVWSLTPYPSNNYVNLIQSIWKSTDITVPMTK